MPLPVDQFMHLNSRPRVRPFADDNYVDGPAPYKHDRHRADRERELDADMELTDEALKENPDLSSPPEPSPPPLSEALLEPNPHLAPRVHKYPRPPRQPTQS